MSRHEHDGAGRTTLRQKTRLSKKPDTWHYTWDAEDRLTQAVTPDGTTWRYEYDALGRRTAKHSPTERVDFTWDGPTLVEQTTNAPSLPNPVTLTWDHQGFTPLPQNGTPDGRGDPTGDRLPLLRHRHRPDRHPHRIGRRTRRNSLAHPTTLWDTTTWHTNSTTYTPLRFPGQYHDPETGLHYNYFRHYDPTTARYLTPDPLGLAPAPNPAAYVDNPHAWSDPLGLAPSGCPKDQKRKRAEDLQPDPSAQGSHTVFERDENGRVTRYQTWHEEPRNPTGWNKGPRFRGTGGPHKGIDPPVFYPTGGWFGRTATGDELPLGY